MPTYNQISRKPRIKQKRKNRFPPLKSRPQVAGVVVKVLTRSPKKPNSAIRKICIAVISTGRRMISASKRVINTTKKVTSYIKGEGHNIQEHSEVLIGGARRRDLPGVRSCVIRGTRDCVGVLKRANARSKYGAPKK